MSDSVSTPPRDEAPATPSPPTPAPPSEPFFPAEPIGLDPILPPPGESLSLAPVGDFPLSFGGTFLTQWTPAQIEAIELDATNTIPLVRPNNPDFLPGYHMTDHWVVKTREGEIAQIDGNYVVVGLFYPTGDLQGRVEEGNTNTYGYIYSPDGRNWSLGGVLVDPRDEDVPGEELFSGSAMWDEATGTLYAFTTNVSEEVSSPSVDQPVQRMGVSTFRLAPDSAPGELRFENLSHQILLEPDGRYYVEPEDAKTGDEVYGFRDPVFFSDPRTGQEYLTFTANLADQAPTNDGVVGIAALNPGEEITGDWTLLPPLLGAIGTNEQLERPHFVYMDDKYYLFFSTHERTFLGEVEGGGPDGLYGFVGSNLWGPYYPLNDSGLVLGNPPEAPTQLYSFVVEKTSEDTAAVLSFVFDYLSTAGGSDAGDRFSYGGTPAPVMSIRIEDDLTALTSIPPPRAQVPDAGDPLVPYAPGEDGGGVANPSAGGASMGGAATAAGTMAEAEEGWGTPEDGWAWDGMAAEGGTVDWHAFAQRVMQHHEATGDWYM